MGSLKTFEELKCWQACRDLRRFVMKSVIPSLPKDEKYRLADQLIRAARSTTANIAEGYGRFHYLDTKTFELGEELPQNPIKILNGYISYLQRSASNPDNSQLITDNC